jgi:hypothetical protein
MIANSFRRSVLLFLLSPLCSLCLCGESRAALDPETRKPYHLRVVLHINEHPQLSAAYKERVGRELGEAIKAALGDLAIVEVVREHPRLAEVLDKGLGTLDSWKERSGIKTHFVLVRYTGFDFEIQARQHDGVTGQASLFTGQVARLEKTRDREFVARAAALMVARDFGIIGTVIPPTDGTDLLKVAIKGAGLGVPLSSWVHKDEVFGLVGIPADNGPEVVFPWALLRVESAPKDGDRDGVTMCRFHFRHINPFLNPGAYEGFRCVKLGTTRGPVRLRLTQRSASGTSEPLTDPLKVEVRRFAFKGEDGSVLQQLTDRDGTFDSSTKGAEGIYEHVAFVTLLSGDTPRVPKLPVPILGEQALDVIVPAAAEGDGLFRFQRDEWTRNVTDSYLVQKGLFKRLNELAAKADQRQAALAEAKSGLDRCRADFTRLTADRKTLEAEIQKLPKDKQPNLSAWDDRLATMKTNETQLVLFIDQIDKVNREENDPKRKEWLAQVQRANLLENEYEYGQAIELLEKTVASGLMDLKVNERIARLKKEWETKSPDHREAREFIYNVWGTLDTKGLKEKLAAAEKHLETCKAVNDRVGPLKMRELMIAHGQRVEKELALLNPRLNPDDDEKTTLIKELSPKLDKLLTELNAYLKTAKP